MWREKGFRRACLSSDFSEDSRTVVCYTVWVYIPFSCTVVLVLLRVSGIAGSEPGFESAM